MSEQNTPKSRNDTPLVETQWMTVEHVRGRWRYRDLGDPTPMANQGR